MRYVGRHRRRAQTLSEYNRQGGYSGSKPASSMPPPARVPSATIRPRTPQNSERRTVLAPPNSPRLVIRYYVPKEPP